MPLDWICVNDLAVHAREFCIEISSGPSRASSLAMRVKTLRHLLLISAVVICSATAQDPPSRAGRISLVSGSVSFEPAGVNNWVPAIVNRPLTMGDQLYVDGGGRAVVHVPGTAFRLGDHAAFEFMNLDDRMVQVRLSEGTLDLRVRNLYGGIEVDTPNMAFTVSGPGEYRLDVNADGGQTLITARDGSGQVAAAGGSFELRMGQQAVVAGQGQAAQYKINPAPGYDSFDRWVMSRNQMEDRYAHSGRVSAEMVGYEDLDQYGTWRPAPGYGEVWVPNGVAAGWAPYHDGHWAWIDPWGWTWVDDEPWGFAPFHYGRWAYLDGYWGWCPGPVAITPVYAPALVAWIGFGGGFGVSIGLGAGPAVGWFPLGPRDVYIPPFAASAAFVTRLNVANTTVINAAYVNRAYVGYERTRSIPIASYMNRTAPGAITAVPETALATARPVKSFGTRVQPNQIASIRTAEAAPRVAPQLASVLGRAPGGNAAHPAAAVLNRQVVARTTPPTRPPSFEQRQAAFARNPGHPLSTGQLHQMATARGEAASRPIAVESQVRPITPAVAQRGSASRPFEPPSAQRAAARTTRGSASRSSAPPARSAPRPQGYRAKDRQPSQAPAPAMRQLHATARSSQPAPRVLRPAPQPRPAAHVQPQRQPQLHATARSSQPAPHVSRPAPQARPAPHMQPQRQAPPPPRAAPERRPEHH